MNPETQAVGFNTLILSVAELGAMKSTVDSLVYSRNTTEKNKIAKLIVSFLSQISRVRGGKALTNIQLLGYSTSYSLEGDDLTYSFEYKILPVKEGGKK